MTRVNSHKRACCSPSVRARCCGSWLPNLRLQLLPTNELEHVCTQEAIGSQTTRGQSRLDSPDNHPLHSWPCRLLTRCGRSQIPRPLLAQIVLLGSSRGECSTSVALVVATRAGTPEQSIASSRRASACCASPPARATPSRKCAAKPLPPRRTTASRLGYRPTDP